ncbi:MAG TPA: hypothetical protein DCO79_13650 [Spirochaeta sp.]|nr:hypothetical protein [Spirochaeta sp.]
MTLTFSSGSTLLIFFGIVLAAVIILMILRPGKRGQKLLSIVILLVTFSVVYFIFGRPTEILIDSEGIHSEAYGKINFAWTDVNDAEIIENYEDTGWKPSVKINGSGLIGFRAGRYRLTNGDTAKILTQKSDKAIVFQTKDEIYLFALDETDKLIEIASDYIEF